MKIIQSAVKANFESSGDEASLKRAVWISVIFHLILFILFAVRAALAPSQVNPFETAIRVDMVGLPDKMPAKIAPPPKESEAPKAAEAKPKPELPKPEAKPETKPELPKPAPVVLKPDSTKVNLQKTKQEQQSALKRLSAMEKLKKMSSSTASNSAKETSAADSEPNPSSSSTVVKGNEISKGSSLSGLAKLENENYVEKVRSQINSRWNLPHWLATANLTALVRLYIDERGGLIKKELIRSSKNPVFDESAMKAIESSLPLARPPSDLANRISVFGIDIEFVPPER